MASTISIAILANAQNAVKGLKDTADQAEKSHGSLTKMGVALGTLGGNLAFSGLKALGGFLVDQVKGSEDGARALKVLNSQINNLGASGKAAFAGADDFANKFGVSIGQDDDNVRAVMTKLASFPDAFKAGSLGAEGMKRSVAAAFDLQAIGIGDAQSNIVGIGKAMNDPIKGMSALAKSGVSFTDEQQKQITNYVKQGDLAGAQKVLLAGIESNAKGAAAAAVSPLEQANVAFQQIAGSVTDMLLPAINAVASWIASKVLPAAQQLVDYLGPKLTAGFAVISAFVTGKLIPAVKDLAAWFGPRLAAGFKVVQDAVAAVLPTVLQIAEWLGPKIESAVKGAGSAIDGLMGALKNPAVQALLIGILAVVAAMKVYAIYQAIVTTATKVWTAVQVALDAAMDANPIGIIILAVIGLVAAIVYIATKTTWFQQLWAVVWGAVQTAAGAVWDWLKSAFNAVVDYLISVWDGIKDLWNTAVSIFDAIKGAIQTALNWVGAQVQAAINRYIAVWNGIKVLWDFAVSIFDGVKSAISSAVDWVRDRISQGVSNIKGVWNGITSLVDTVLGVRDRVISAVSGLVGKFEDLGHDIINGVVNGVKSAASNLTGYIRSLFGDVIGIAKNILHIGSPSKVFADLGKNTVLGFIGGLDSNAPKLERALAAISQTVADTSMSFGAVEIGGAFTADSGSASAPPVVVYVTVNVADTVNSPELGRRIAQHIGDYVDTYRRPVRVTP